MNLPIRNLKYNQKIPIFNYPFHQKLLKELYHQQSLLKNHTTNS
jgi:hypothetical protein